MTQLNTPHKKMMWAILEDNCDQVEVWFQRVVPYTVFGVLYEREFLLLISPVLHSEGFSPTTLFLHL